MTKKRSDRIDLLETSVAALEDRIAALEEMITAQQEVIASVLAGVEATVQTSGTLLSLIAHIRQQVDALVERGVSQPVVKVAASAPMLRSKTPWEAALASVPIIGEPFGSVACQQHGAASLNRLGKCVSCVNAATQVHYQRMRQPTAA